MAKVYKSSAQNCLTGADILIAGLFSAKDKDYEAAMVTTANLATARGAHVVDRIVQRRGVSDGGVLAMTRPFSRQTLLIAGKVREIVLLCHERHIGAVVFVNALTARQSQILADKFGCPVFSHADLL